MKKLLPILKTVVADVAGLRTASKATAAAGVLAPFIALVLGADVTAAEVEGWLALVGAAVYGLEKKPAKPAAK